jgi:hypothetical protein
MHDQQDEEYDEQDIGDVHREPRYTTGTESAGDEGEHEKDYGPTEHERSFQND